MRVVGEANEEVAGGGAKALTDGPSVRVGVNAGVSCGVNGADVGSDAKGVGSCKEARLL